jgi:hypothetical protein
VRQVERDREGKKDSEAERERDSGERETVKHRERESDERGQQRQ